MATAMLRGLWQAVRPHHRTARGKTKGPEQVVLEEGAVWSCRVRAGGLRLTCCEGLLWLTHEGEPTDKVVKAGGSVRLDGPGLVVVQALRPARFGPSEP
ncbi:hypothetical protein CYFUS_001540 [Cystobacter fuscus]|uniref:DUF2917 domain-containing protein n=1 Tax=Cystobacter fuscus TaxID=43 RepID=A0A250IYY9_9BACT|nr:DUF2917 domain-containing protein [Cystobacter fuscus]ATB36126.1 hypothetical protein CYFUS_001540 [Cystobacter fuscus]